MADISKVTLPNGQTYDIKDTVARAAIAAAANIQYSVVTALPDAPEDFNKTPIIYLVAHTHSDTNDAYDEYIYISDKWEKIGNTDVDLSKYVKDEDLGALAKKDSVSGTYTPEGTMTITSMDGETAEEQGLPSTYTPVGKVSAPTFTGDEETIAITPEGEVAVTPTTESINQITDVGTLPTWDASVENETLSFNFGAGTLPTKAAATVATGITSATFTGKEGSAKVTPTGKVSEPTFTGRPARIAGTFTGKDATITSK